MRKFILAAILGLAAATPASAAAIGMPFGGPAPAAAAEAPIVLAQRYRERVIIRDRDRRPGWRHRFGDRCRIITTRRRLPNGDVVVRRVRRCR